MFLPNSILPMVKSFMPNFIKVNFFVIQIIYELVQININ
jgi:hypothetical protein